MPEKTVLLIFENIPEPVRAALLAAVVALARILYDGKEPRWVRRFLEATLCGLIALGIALWLLFRSRSPRGAFIPYGTAIVAGIYLATFTAPAGGLAP